MTGKTVVSPTDKELMEKYGAAVIECSWAWLADVPFHKIGGKCETAGGDQELRVGLNSRRLLVEC